MSSQDIHGTLNESMRNDEKDPKFSNAVKGGLLKTSLESLAKLWLEDDYLETQINPKANT